MPPDVDQDKISLSVKTFNNNQLEIYLSIYLNRLKRLQGINISFVK